ncbi:hypothetical protein GWI33_003958 [Rhynchophorus ferrugineus]|uniref:Uncharacterized protein n=1 Tax=Rhynchophorus ferrugineus TaxID=354439 RepID=A0A834HIA0_RHYFE|nr:hypothetical protein GWI33_003958 [Rhynchophorus ferrugineus]
MNKETRPSEIPSNSWTASSPPSRDPAVTRPPTLVLITVLSTGKYEKSRPPPFLANCWRIPEVPAARSPINSDVAIDGPGFFSIKKRTLQRTTETSFLTSLERRVWPRIGGRFGAGGLAGCRRRVGICCR